MLEDLFTPESEAFSVISVHLAYEISRSQDQSIIVISKNSPRVERNRRKTENKMSLLFDESKFCFLSLEFSKFSIL